MARQIQEMPEKIPNDEAPLPLNMTAVAKCVVLTPEGGKVQMSQLWASQTAIFIFLRHFACIACRAHARQVWSEREKYESSGGRLIFIGNGQPHFINQFRLDLGLGNALILTDPTRVVFKTAGFHEGFFYVVRPQTVQNIIRMMREGHKQVAYTPDAGKHFQLGGILVVSPAGRATYHYISESLGDFPEEKQLKFIQRNET